MSENPAATGGAVPPVDLGMALAAGPLVWRQADVPVNGGGYVAAIGLLGLLTAAVAGVVAGPPATRWGRTLPLSGLAVSTVVLAAPLLVFLVDRGWLPVMSDRPGAAIAVRAVSTTCFVTSWLLVAQRAALPLFAAMSTFVAADLSLSAWQLHAPVATAAWARRALVSWPTVGVFAAVIVAVALGARVSVALVSAALGYAILLLAIVQAQLLGGLRARMAATRSDHDRLTIASEHRRRSHWLHDDVLSLVTGVQMKLERDKLSPADVARELRELDHQLRLRQADEQLRSGSASLGELLQPYLRQAQNLGVRVTEAPTSDTASLRLDEVHARRAQRVLGVAIPNSVKAGATAIAVRFHPNERDSSLDIEVEDDAGGFDFAALPVGRGLQALISELEPPNRISFESTPVGTRVIAHLEMGEVSSS